MGVVGLELLRQWAPGISAPLDRSVAFLRPTADTPAFTLRQGMAGERITAFGLQYTAMEEWLSGQLRTRLLMGQGSSAYAEPTWALEVDYQF